MSSTLASSDEELDLICALEEVLLEDEDQREWRANDSLSIDDASPQRDRKDEIKNAKQEAKEQKAIFKKIAEQRPVEGGARLQFRFESLSEGKSELGWPATTAAPDLKIASKYAEFIVHRGVLAAHSDYFDKILPVVERGGQPRRIGMWELDPLTLLLILRFCYLGTYDIHATSDLRILNAGDRPVNPTNTLAIHVRAFNAAKKFPMSELRDMIIAAFQQELSDKLCDGWTAPFIVYEQLARQLLWLTLGLGTKKPGRGGELRDCILDAWKKDDCKLGRGYLTEGHFQVLLGLVPEVFHELVSLSPAEEQEYMRLQKTMRSMKKSEQRAEVRTFFAPLGLHQPVDKKA